jgi:hypothetical protein
MKRIKEQIKKMVDSDDELESQQFPPKPELAKVLQCHCCIFCCSVKVMMFRENRDEIFIEHMHCLECNSSYSVLLDDEGIGILETEDSWLQRLFYLSLN